MKKYIALVVILLEMIGILAINVIYANNLSKLNATNISIPDNLKLTIKEDISKESRDGSFIIPKDTVICPEYVFPDRTVCFHFEGNKERVHIEWEKIEEESILEELNHEAELKREEHQKDVKTRGLIIGVAEGVLWIVLGGLLSYALMKKEKYTLLIIIHFIFFLAVLLLLYSNANYLSH